MKIKVHSILWLKEAFGGKDIEMMVPEGLTVGGLLSRLLEIRGDNLSPLLFDPESGQPLSHIRLLVNGQTIEFLNKMDTVLNDGDEVLLLPPAVGG